VEKDEIIERLKILDVTTYSAINGSRKLQMKEEK